MRRFSFKPILIKVIGAIPTTLNALWKLGMRRFSTKSIYIKVIGAIPTSLKSLWLVGMRRNFYFLGFTLILAAFLALFPTACVKKFSVAPASVSVPTITPTPTATHSLMVTTLAGSGIPGSTNGTGTAASFNQPLGIAVDSSGNVFVAEAGNHLIRKITSGGDVTTLAGSGTAGSANGTGTAASFNLPIGVAVDASGNVHVSDFGNHLIRKITPGSVVTTLAGTGTVGSDNGPALMASFNYPTYIAVDSSGSIYVSDEYNHLIRKIQ